MGVGTLKMAGQKNHVGIYTAYRGIKGLACNSVKDKQIALLIVVHVGLHCWLSPSLLFVVIIFPLCSSFFVNVGRHHCQSLLFIVFKFPMSIANTNFHLIVVFLSPKHCCFLSLLLVFVVVVVGCRLLSLLVAFVYCCFCSSLLLFVALVVCHCQVDCCIVCCILCCCCLLSLLFAVWHCRCSLLLLFAVVIVCRRCCSLS